MILNTGRMFLHRRCLAVASDWLLSRLAAYRQAGGVRATQCTSIRPITTIRTRTKDLPLSPPQYLALVRLGSEVERAEGFAATLEPLHFPTRREPERRLDAPRAVDGSAAVRPSRAALRCTGGRVDGRRAIASSHSSPLYSTRLLYAIVSWRDLK